MNHILIKRDKAANQDKRERGMHSMDHPHGRSAINDPNQCRLCMRVCDDNFLECIFSDKEYSIAHQIFECTSIRVSELVHAGKPCMGKRSVPEFSRATRCSMHLQVTKQDNLTKICKNCASLLFLTTEFRNTCFKTNRLLMEDFVILELGDWASEGNRLLLRECESFIVRHKQQVDYLYASIVSEGEQYLEGVSLEIGTELFGSDGQQAQPPEEQQPLAQAQTDKGGEGDRAPGAGQQTRLEQCEPDPEILMEISKFLEEQTPRHSQQDRSECVTDTSLRCGLCCTVSELPTCVATSQYHKILEAMNFESSTSSVLRLCEECRMLLAIVDAFQKTSSLARDLSAQKRTAWQTVRCESVLEQAKPLLERLKQKHEVFAGLQCDGARQDGRSLPAPQTDANSAPKKAYKRAKVTCHICGKQYDSWKLQTHLNEHENIRPYVCDQEGCSSTFAGLVLLNRHKKLWHTDYYYAVCNVCGKKCKTQGIYKTHLSYHEEPKLPCTVCGKLMRNK
uniref:C2H2-type domain-containing protein n=1 Tax=Anopheles epiroticus TaxID=199890 RepID=A0A182PV87_9DIPT